MNKRVGKSNFISLIVLIGDFLIINLLFLILFYLPWPWITDNVLVYTRQMMLALNVSYLIVSYFVRVQHDKRIFEFDKLMRFAFYVISFHFIVFYFLFNFLELNKISFQFLLVYFSILFITIFTWWAIVRILLKMYRKRGYNYRSVVILGAGKNGVSLAKKIGKDPTYGFRLLGFFDDNPDVYTGDLPLLGRIDDLPEYITNNQIDEVYCALPHSEGDRIIKLIDFAEKKMVRFFIIPGYYTYLKRKVDLHTLNGIPYLSLFNEPLENDLNRGFKRIFDIIFSLTVLIFIFPVIYIFAAIAIKLSSPGPIFFRQIRTGLKGEDFKCYKFRTMRVNSDADKMQALKDDPRKTAVGDFLRKSNIDELPQFYNVLKGDMSVVGPRPHMLKHTEDYSALIDKYMIRHLVKPGLTGWAQVNGFRGETKLLEQMENRVGMDVWYIENWTPWLDFKIVMKTIVNVFAGEKNAY